MTAPHTTGPTVTPDIQEELTTYCMLFSVDMCFIVV